MKILLSIKPEFAEKIFEGSKAFEFRRTIFKSQKVSTVVVYASSPVKKVIGEFEIDLIIKADLNVLWKETSHKAGIEEASFFKYFEGKQEGFAIKIKKAFRYETPLCIKENFNAHPPQSFIYL